MPVRPEDTKMELKCGVAKPVIRYLETRLGRPSMVAHMLDIGMDLDYLLQDNNWISYDYYCRLLRGLVEATHDPQSPFTASKLYTDKLSYNAVGLFFIHLGTPATVFRLIPPFHSLWTKVNDWRVAKLTNRSCEVSIHYTQCKPDRNNCLAIQGSIASIPQSFGLPSAKVEHVQCACDGAPSCVFSVSWINRPTRSLSLILAGLGLVLSVLIGLGIVPGGAAVWHQIFLPIALYCIGRLMEYRKLMLRTYMQNEDQASSLLDLLKTTEALNRELEQRVRDRTAQLEVANKELEAFSYSVSHDLRSPLKLIEGFSYLVLKEYGSVLPKSGQQDLERIHRAALKMSELIDALLMLSRVTQQNMKFEPVDLSQLASEITEEFSKHGPDRSVEFVIQQGLKAQGDVRLLRAVLQNLLANAWKFTRNTSNARIEFGSIVKDGKNCLFIRDNGAGFNMKYADRLFGAFQRLHSETEYEGTGVGLVTVQRIVKRHGGSIWADSEVGRGATFFFTINDTGMANA